MLSPAQKSRPAAVFQFAPASAPKRGRIANRATARRFKVSLPSGFAISPRNEHSPAQMLRMARNRRAARTVEHGEKRALCRHRRERRAHR